MRDLKESYSQKGSFKRFLSFTNEKEVTLQYILKNLGKNIDLSKKKVTFTDIGAGDGVLTVPIVQFLEDRLSVKTICIEPSDLIDSIKEKLGRKAKYIKKDMEMIALPHADFILMAHVLNHVKNKKKFAGSLKDALNEGGKILVVGTAKTSDDSKLRNYLKERKVRKRNREDIFEYLRNMGFAVREEKMNAIIDIRKAVLLKKEGNPIISFFFHKPFEDITKEEIEKFRDAARQLAPKGKLQKTLRFVWVGK